MARRRNPFGPPRRSRSANINAPSAIKVAPIKLDNGLTLAYEWMAADRALGLQLASDWYVENTPKLLRLHPVTAADTDRQSQYNKALKAKDLGNNAGATEGERTTAWQMAIRLYEKVFSGASLPTLAAAEKAATEEPTRRIKNVKTVLDSLNAAFNPVGIKYAPRAVAERDFSENTMWIPQAELEQMVALPPLKLALAEAATVAQALSVRFVNSQPEIDCGALLTNVPFVLNSLYAWAEQSNGSVLLKAVGKVATAKQATVKSAGAATAPRHNASAVQTPNNATVRVINLGVIRPTSKIAKAALNFVDGKTVAETRAYFATLGIDSWYTGKALRLALSLGAISLQ
jgi:hypothetical protein